MFIIKLFYQTISKLCMSHTSTCSSNDDGDNSHGWLHPYEPGVVQGITVHNLLNSYKFMRYYYYIPIFSSDVKKLSVMSQSHKKILYKQNLDKVCELVCIVLNTFDIFPLIISVLLHLISSQILQICFCV